jgi:hypothetical protein
MKKNICIFKRRYTTERELRDIFAYELISAGKSNPTDHLSIHIIYANHFGRTDTSRTTTNNRQGRIWRAPKPNTCLITTNKLKTILQHYRLLNNRLNFFFCREKDRLDKQSSCLFDSIWTGNQGRDEVGAKQGHITVTYHPVFCYEQSRVALALSSKVFGHCQRWNLLDLNAGMGEWWRIWGWKSISQTSPFGQWGQRQQACSSFPSWLQASDQIRCAITD